METKPFGETLGPKAQRRRPRLDVGTFEELSKVDTVAAERLVEGSSGITIMIHYQFVLFFYLFKKLILVVTVSVCVCGMYELSSDRQDIYNTLPQDTLRVPSTHHRITSSERVLSYSSFASFHSFIRIRSKSP